MDTIFPRSIAPGDKVAILSPASIINPEYVDGACRWLRQRGYQPVVEPHTLGSGGSYSGTPAERLADFRAALADPDVRAVLCSRGGYGAVHLIPEFPVDEWLADPRWLIGFSDISALHAMLNSRGIVSVHASMCKALALREADDADNSRLFSILEGARPAYGVDPHPFNRLGEASGCLRGGNLAVIADLIATPVSPFADPEGTILFIEDIAEPIYKVERILWQLRLMGFLDRVAGIIIGQFTDYRPDRNFPDMYTMLDAALSGVTCPVAFNFPVGHVDHNLPLLSGAPATLSVTPALATLSFV
ncbi:LD-carboxypeptidase [Muribaculum sp.]|uniref:S66 peptidase family protein n=1 Tax=Muribaculum sp. TaxID=1918611 RepID=UPI0023C63622|nr:LD-carboxypeptidase [Muribaculum sp.]MDE5705880.1 LD-carboxypeptidase [Muribaculum sp.]